MTEETKQCPYCGSEIPVSVKKCKYCGEWLVVQEKDKPKASMHLGTIIEVLIAILSIPIGLNIGADSAITFIIAAYIILNLYFLPTLIADGKRTQYTPAIFALDLFLGWTIIGWLGSLIWALTLPNLSKNVGTASNGAKRPKTYMQAKNENKTIQENSTQNIDIANMSNETKKCPYCAELIPQNSTFCNICETSLTENLSNKVPQIEYTNITKCASNDETPNNIKQWNWGAFWLSWIWGIGNKSYKTLWALIPYFGFIWMFVCGAKGNEWAWENKQWSSVEDYNNTQRKWAIAGNVLTVLLLILTLACYIVAQNISNEPVSKEQTTAQEEVNSDMEEHGDVIDMSEEDYNRFVRESQQQEQISKQTQQATQQKTQPQPVVQQKQQAIPVQTNVAVPQAKPIQTPQQNQDIDDFMN